MKKCQSYIQNFALFNRITTKKKFIDKRITDNGEWAMGNGELENG
jgi:hypothetical protein